MVTKEIKEVIKGYIKDSLTIDIEERRDYYGNHESIEVSLYIEGEYFTSSACYLTIPEK